VKRTRSAWQLIGLVAALTLAGCEGGSDGVVATTGPGAGGGGGTGGGGGGSGGGGGTPSGTTGVNDSQLKILATNLGSPYNVLVDANNVYWNDAQTDAIGAVPIDGSAAATFIVASGSATGVDLAQDPVNIYFTSSDFSLRRVAKTGGTVTPLSTSSTQNTGCNGSLCSISPTGLLVSGTRVIFGNASRGVSGSGNLPTAVMSIGTNATNLANLATSNAPTSSSPVLVATNGSVVYFAYNGNVTGNAIKSVAVTGGAATTVFPGVGDVSAIAVTASGAGAGSVFFAGRAPGATIETLRRFTGSTVTLLDTITTLHASSIALDDQNVYYPKFDSNSSSMIAKKSLTTGAETILAGVAATNGIVGGLVVDGANVYWAAPTSTSGKGSIRSVPKT
jgi:hypothetical protein